MVSQMLVAGDNVEHYHHGTNTKGNSDFCRSSTEIRMFAHISVEVLQKSVKVFEKNCVQQL